MDFVKIQNSTIKEPMAMVLCPGGCGGQQDQHSPKVTGWIHGQQHDTKGGHVSCYPHSTAGDVEDIGGKWTQKAAKLMYPSLSRLQG